MNAKISYDEIASIKAHDLVSASRKLAKDIFEYRKEKIRQAELVDNTSKREETLER